MALAMLASLFTFLAVTLVLTSLLRPRGNPLTGHLAPVAAATTGHGGELDKSAWTWDRVGGSLFGVLIGVVWRSTPPRMLDHIDAQLTLAGRPGGISAPAFLTLIFLVSISVPSAYLLLGAGLRTSSSSQLLIALVLAGLCLQAPRSWLSFRAKKRQKQVQKSLPDALDLIVVCVEAGLGLDAALAKVAEETQGPLAGELRRALVESSMGKLRRTALRDMANRLQVTDLTSFIAALCQADQMGTSLAQVLRAQAAQMRVKRRQRAEQEAMRAPLKMLFPLVFFIFPAVFVIILGPAAINLMSTFAGQ